MDIADFDKASNLVSLFLARADERGEAPFLWAKRDGQWHSISWAEAARRVCVLAESLIALGLQPGDRVMLVSENRPEWCLADFAVMAAGGITVPAYVTNTTRDHLHVLENSGARIVIVSDGKLAKALLPAVLEAGERTRVIGIEKMKLPQAGTMTFHDWATLTKGDAAAARRAVNARIATITRADTACLIYTSGTGGAPRGVMQHHGALLCNADGAARVLVEDFNVRNGGRDEVFLSFLPLSHSYEHTAGQYLPIGMGAQIYYAEVLDKLSANIEEVRPTVMVVVPLVWALALMPLAPRLRV